MNTTNVLEKIQQGVEEQKKLGAAYLRLQIAPNAVAAVAMQAARAALVVNVDRLTPLPNMPSYVIGLLAHRSRVLWALDLAKILGYPPVDLRRSKVNIVLLEIDRQVVAFAVPEISGVLRFMPEEIISPLANFSSELVPYLQGWLPYEGETLLILSARALVTTMPNRATA
jgi:positive phototaxis protein PixI